MHDSEKREIVIQWFIYGGAVLGAGLLLGLLVPFLILAADVTTAVGLSLPQ